MAQKAYRLPGEDAVLHPVRRGAELAAARMEHRGGETLIWPDDWYEGEDGSGDACGFPLGAAAGILDAAAAEAWLAGFYAGEDRGLECGRAQGFRACQAGFRALLGTSSAADVSALLGAARDAGDR